MGVEHTVDETAMRVWEEQQQSVVDKYGYYAFQVMGLTGIAASVTASFWGGFRFEIAYILIFFLSFLFFMGGYSWRKKDKPTKEELRHLHVYEMNKKFDSDSTYKRVSEERKEQLKEDINTGNWADRR